jgi:hypothetical protein
VKFGVVIFRVVGNDNHAAPAIEAAAQVDAGNSM